MKKTARALRIRCLLVLLSVILAFPAIYRALPWIIAESLRYRLVLAGFTQVEVRTGYPSRDELSLDAIQLSRRSGNRISTLRATGVTVRYRPLELLSGRFARIHIPHAEIESGFIAGEAPARDEPAETARPSGLGALAPRYLLSRLPSDEAYLDALDAEFRIPDGRNYRVHATGRVANEQGLLTGEIRPAEGQALAFSAHVTASGGFELDLRAAGVSAPPVLHVVLHATAVDDRHLHIDGSARAELDGIMRLLRTGFRSEEKWPALAGTLESRWQGVVPMAADDWDAMKIGSDHSLKIKTGRANDAIRAIESRLEASVGIEGRRIRWRIGNRSELSARFEGRTDASAEPRIAMTFPNGMAGQAEIATERLNLRVAPGFSAHLVSALPSGFSSSGIDIELADGANLSYDTKPGRWAWEPFAFSTRPASLNWPGGAVEADAIALKIGELAGERAEWRGKGELRVANLKPKIQGKPLPAGEVRVEFQANPKQLGLEGAVTLSHGRVTLTGRARHALAGGGGSAQFDLTPVVFGESDFKLSQLLEPWPYPLDLHAGRIEAAGDSSWSRAPSRGALHFENRFTVTAEGLAGRFQSIGFKGLDARLVLSDLNGLQTVDPARISVARLDAGIPLTHLIMDAAVAGHAGSSGPTIDLRQFDVDLLGGTAHGGPVRWNAAHPDSPVVLALKRISLSQIVALERQQGVEASGLLDGRLPLEITKTHVALRGGELQARPPGGWIRYRPTEKVKAMAGANPGLEFVNQALSNLQYETLKVNADSTPAGDLALRVGLRGHNPDWQSDRPIHLNLNLQENVLMLLRSLRVADDLTDRMNRQIQERYRKKH
ncbi:intermembrane phospholipid transport protein YdbH family protein [Methylocaldum sp. MU1018]